MSEIRSVTNLIGNGVATIVISKWERALDHQKAKQVLDQETEMQADDPEEVADEDLDDELEDELPVNSEDKRIID